MNRANPGLIENSIISCETHTINATLKNDGMLNLKGEINIVNEICTDTHIHIIIMYILYAYIYIYIVTDSSGLKVFSIKENNVSNRKIYE